MGYKMKRFLTYVLISLLFFTHTALAQGMAKKTDIKKTYLSVTGIPDYPPFSYYTEYKSSSLHFFELKSVFLKPLSNTLSKRKIKIQTKNLNEKPDVQNLVISTNDGHFNLFIGAYADTKLFKGLDLIYPASVSNPIHIITLPNDNVNIKKTGDLAKYKGVVIKSEYFSDFVLRKIKQLNITFVETPYEAYEMLFTNQAQYIIGGIYYNKIKASQYGIEQYLSFSKKPLFKIPVFIAITKQMRFSQDYKNMLSSEFKKEDFSLAVKEEILKMVNDEIEKNIGVVPPSFAQKKQEQPVPNESKEQIGNKEQNEKMKSIDEISDRI